MPFFIYNPGQKSKKESIAEFVLHQYEYEDIMSSLERSTMEYPAQHFMIVGQRGMGKTTLLRRLQIGVEDSGKLKDWLIPVLFTEEQYQITSLVDLWEYVAEYLDDLSDFSGLTAPIRAVHYHPHLEERAFESIKAALQAKGKKLVLLLDNLGELFRKLEPLEMHRLRAILQTENCLRIIGGSISLEGLLDYHKPFYDFFKIIRLENLGSAEAVKFLLQLASLRGEKDRVQGLLSAHPGRVETLRIMTGGIPRTIAILFGIFLDQGHGEAIDNLQSVIDAVTPLYKHRMDDLPIQQQKIMDAVARHWEPITVKELAEKTRLVSKTLSAQLNAMEKDHLIIKHDTHNKNKTYQVRERFWNIWYLMRYGHKGDKARIIWLAKFLEGWLSIEELEMRVLLFTHSVMEDKMTEDQMVFFSQVYTSLGTLTTDCKLMLKGIEDKMPVKTGLGDKELDDLAWESLAKKDPIKALHCLSLKTNMLAPDPRLFMEMLGSFKLKMGVEETFGLLRILEREKTALFLFCSFMKDLSDVLEATPPGDVVIRELKKIIPGIIIIMESSSMMIEELGLALAATCGVIRGFVKHDLHKIALSIIEGASAEKDGRTTYLKDVMKPLHLALKYLYQPTELDKQPAELREPAERIVKQLLGLDQENALVKG